MVARKIHLQHIQAESVFNCLPQQRVKRKEWETAEGREERVKGRDDRQDYTRLLSKKCW